MPCALSFILTFILAIQTIAQCENDSLSIVQALCLVCSLLTFYHTSKPYWSKN